MDDTLLNPTPITGKDYRIPAVMACFLAVVASTAPLVFYSVEPSATWLLSLTYFYAGKAAVPVLLMVLGYVALDRQDSYLQTFSRVAKTGVWLLLFTLAWYLAKVLAASSASISLRALARVVLKDPVQAYLPVYTYLGILLMLPFLQKLAAAMDRKDFHVFFLLSGGICGVWPVAEHYLPKLAFSAQELLPLFGGCIAMIFAGCYAKRYFVPSKKWRAAAMAGFVFTCLVNVGLTYLEYRRSNAADYLFFENITYLPILAEGVCLFCILLTAKPGKTLQKCIGFLSPLIFGMYFAAGLAVPLFQTGYYFLVSGGVHPLLSLLLFQVFILALSTLASWLLKKLLPGLRFLKRKTEA